MNKELHLDDQKSNNSSIFHNDIFDERKKSFNLIKELDIELQD